MTLTFIKYEQVSDQVSVGVNDARSGFRKLDFTYSAVRELIESPDRDHSDVMKRIRQAFIDKGGMKWLDGEIYRFRKGLIQGSQEMIPGKI